MHSCHVTQRFLLEQASTEPHLSFFFFFNLNYIHLISCREVDLGTEGNHLKRDGDSCKASSLPCLSQANLTSSSFLLSVWTKHPQLVLFLNRILSFRLHTVNLTLHAYLERATQVLVTTLNSPVKVGVPDPCDCLGLAEEVSDSLEIWPRLMLGPVTSKC